jgi:predicted AlkP superfamily phosphohydrolase/phosphomutase
MGPLCRGHHGNGPVTSLSVGILFREVESASWALSRILPARGSSLFAVLSDHGFTRIKSEVYINRILQEAGFLSFKSENPKGVREIEDTTRAFALDPARIYVNSKGRYPRGAVDEADVDAVIQDLSALFSEVAFHGEKVVRAVISRDEVYSGPCVKAAPDMVLLSHHGFDLKGTVTKQEVFGRSDLQGMHTQDDAFFFLNGDHEKVKGIGDLKDIIVDAVKGSP